MVGETLGTPSQFDNVEPYGPSRFNGSYSTLSFFSLLHGIPQLLTSVYAGAGTRLVLQLLLEYNSNVFTLQTVLPVPS